jgi:hypothetical protein
LGLSLRPGNRHHDAVGVTAESCVGWTIAGGSIGVAGSWLAGGGARGAEPHGSADFVANACPNVIRGLGERMPVAHTVHVPGAWIHRVSAGGLLADPVHGPPHADLAQHADGNPDPLALYRKEHVHARGLPAGV